MLRAGKVLIKDRQREDAEIKTLIPWTGFILLLICARIFDNCWSTLLLPKKNTNFLWGQSQQESFDHLKQLLTCAPVLFACVNLYYMAEERKTFAIRG